MTHSLAARLSSHRRQAHSKQISARIHTHSHRYLARLMSFRLCNCTVFAHGIWTSLRCVCDKYGVTANWCYWLNGGWSIFHSYPEEVQRNADLGSKRIFWMRQYPTRKKTGLHFNRPKTIQPKYIRPKPNQPKMFVNRVAYQILYIRRNDKRCRGRRKENVLSLSLIFIH